MGGVRVNIDYSVSLSICALTQSHWQEEPVYLGERGSWVWLLSGSRDLTEGYEILTDYQLEIIWLEACLHLYTSDWLGLLKSVYSKDLTLFKYVYLRIQSAWNQQQNRYPISACVSFQYCMLGPLVRQWSLHMSWWRFQHLKHSLWHCLMYSELLTPELFVLISN